MILFRSIDHKFLCILSILITEWTRTIIQVNAQSVPACGLKPIHERIVNGTEAKPNEFPFIVLIKLDGSTACGGAILNAYWVITAAHCFKEREHLIMRFTIDAGSHSLVDGEVYKIYSFIIHPKFSMQTMNSDICLVRVNRPFRFSYKIQTICLPQRRQEEPRGNAMAAGWGQFVYTGRAAKILQKVVLPIISDQQCSNMYSERRVVVYRSNFCTWIKGQDTCKGDSGGPIFQYLGERAFLLGLVSYGWECADDYPGVYTQVSYFLDWIYANAV